MITKKDFLKQWAKLQGRVDIPADCVPESLLVAGNDLLRDFVINEVSPRLVDKSLNATNLVITFDIVLYDIRIGLDIELTICLFNSCQSKEIEALAKWLLAGELAEYEYFMACYNQNILSEVSAYADIFSRKLTMKFNKWLNH